MTAAYVPTRYSHIQSCYRHYLVGCVASHDLSHNKDLKLNPVPVSLEYFQAIVWLWFQISG